MKNAKAAALMWLTILSPAFSAEVLQPPIPTPAEGRQQPQAKAAAADQQAQPDQRGTSNNPLIVKILPAANADEQSNEERENEDQKATNDRLIARATVAIAVITLVLAFVTGGLWFATWRLGRDARISTLRPEITVISFEPSHEGIDNEGIAVQIMYLNRGRFIAKNVHIQARITSRRLPLETGIQPLGIGAIDLHHHDLDSGMKNYFLVVSDIDASSASTLFNSMPLGRAQGNAQIVCIGCISYYDGLGGRRETGFCRIYDAANSQWKPSENTEYEYSY